MATTTDTLVAPHDLEAERAVLGALLLDNEVINEAAEMLTPSSFFGELHGAIFAAILALDDRGAPIDALTIASEMGGDSDLAYLATLTDGLPRSANVGCYANIVKDHEHRRRLARLGVDLTDAALDGRDTARLIDKIAAASAVPGNIRVFDLAEYLSLKMPKRQLLLDPVIREKDLVMAYGFRGVGKTFLGLGIGLAVATGTEFLKWSAPAAASVLLVDGEMPVETLQERVAVLLAGIKTELDATEIPLRILAADAQEIPLPALDTPEGQRILDAHLGDAKLVILDNISTLMGSGPENDAEAWSPAQRLLLSLRRRGVAVLLIHHAGKSGQQRGTSKREDVLDTVLKLVHPSDYEPEQGARFEIRFEKARGLIGEDITPIEARLEIDERGRAVWTCTKVAENKHEVGMEMLKSGAKPDDVAKTLGVHRTTVYKWQKLGRKNGQLPAKGSRSQTRGLVLVPPPEK